ncbi:hypothetical protein CWB41_15920 [Methylovirgula ligni]|uniref:Uncharacterized protein n=1 Tax=Methylovirgula ligni TaxID=569860 RepID=A0A3D9YZ00_9HYPH|nr:hypothetical protein [Methylovirgula ligni]QAY97040.1 hypothetical protein CWB41_15920 [Methylovirgula ligni]REF87891.1 hypothetical protein DES32_1528 [Methylovirgula ligni]
MANVYKIAVALQMTSNAPAFLSSLSKQLLGLDVSAKTLEKSFARLGPALTLGLSAFAASGILAGLKSAADAGKELLDVQNQLARAGLSHAQVAGLTAAAYEKMARLVPTATGADILRTAGQLRVVTGSLPKAISETPEALKIEALLENLTGQSADGAGHQLWRSLEMKGLTGGNAIQQAVAQKLLESFVQDISASGGKLSARDFLNAAKTGGAYWQRAAPDFLAGPGAVVMADLGGDRFGTALASLGQFTSGALTISKQQYETLRAIGMIDPHKVSTDRGGRVNMQPGAIAGSLQYGSDPYAWVQKALLPHLDAAGIKEGPERDSILSKIGRNRNVIRMLDMFSDPGFVAQINKDLSIFRQSQGLDAAYSSYVRNDPKGVDKAFDAQYRSMMMAIGAPLEQAAIPVMSAVTSMFTSIGAFAQKHPNIVKEIGFDALLGPLAAVVNGFRTLGTVFSPLGKSFASLASTMSPLTSATNAFVSALSALGGIFGKIESAIGGLAGKTWAIPAAPGGYLGKNPIYHKSGFVSPALSPSNGATIIKADAGGNILAYGPGGATQIGYMEDGARWKVRHGDDAWDGVRRFDMAMSSVVPKSPRNVQVTVPLEVKLDNKVLTKAVMKRQIAMMTMPLGIHGGPDGYGSFIGPGTSLQNA